MKVAPLNSSFLLASMIGFLVSVLYVPRFDPTWAVAFALWLWPEAYSYALHSLSVQKVIHSLWPIVMGYLIVLVWRWKGQQEAPLDEGRQARAGRLPFHDFYMRLLKWLEMAESMLTKQLVALAEIFLKMLQLRKLEKILGRWTIAGVSYLVLTIALLFLLIRMP